MDWWVIEDVPKPIYIGIRRKRGKWAIISFIIGVFILFILQFIDVFFRELAFILITLLLITQGVQSFLAGFFRSASSSDIAFTKQVLKLLNGEVMVWSIPSSYILVAARLANLSYLYLYIMRGQLYMIYGYPIVHGKIEKPRNRLKIVEVEDYVGIVESIKIGSREYRVKRIDLIAPNPESPKIWYRLKIRGYLFKASEIDPSIVRKLLKK